MPGGFLFRPATAPSFWIRILMKAPAVLLLLLLISSCCDRITVHVVPPSGSPIAGALPIPQPIQFFGSSRSDARGKLRACGEWTTGISAPGYESFMPTHRGEHLSLKDGQRIVLQPRR